MFYTMSAAMTVLSGVLLDHVTIAEAYYSLNDLAVVESAKRTVVEL